MELQLAIDNTLVKTAGKEFTMGNQLTFTGGGELDNGLTVSLSFVLDQGDNAAAVWSGPFDSHSITISSDALGTITVLVKVGNRSISFRYYSCWRYLGQCFKQVLMNNT